jgi:hypothetical protein
MALAKPVWPVLQRGHTLAHGLIGAWPFGEGSGGTLNDLGPRRLAASSLGGSTWVGSEYGSAVSLNGSSQGATIPYAAALDSARTTISFMLFATAAVVSGNYTTLFSQGYDGTTVPRVFDCRINANNNAGVGTNLCFGDYDGASFASASSSLDLSSSANLNRWILVTGVYDGSNYSIYLNGKLDATVAAGHAPSSNTKNFNVGYLDVNGSNGRFFQGSIQNVRIWDRALSAAEIAQDYFDPFAIYRKRSRWWEVLVSGGASSYTVLKASLTLTPKLTSGSTSPAVSKASLTLTPKLVTGTVSSAVLKGLLTLTPKLVSVAGSVFTITKAALALTPKLVTGDLSASAITHSALALTPKLVPSAPVSAIIVRGSLVLLPKGVSSPSILAGLSQKQDLTVVPYHYSHMPADPATQSTYFMREIRRLQSTINDLHKAANQATDEAPLVPLNGMIRYAKGAWASALGGEGLYVYKAGVWTRIV